jgi:hypothetical protein
MENAFEVTFATGNTARALRISDHADVGAALSDLGIDSGRPTLALVGGAGKMSTEDQERLRELFTDAVARIAEQLGAAVVDGGTDAGIMRMMGQARQETKAQFPLLGVVAEGTAFFPGAESINPESAPLEPNHTHFLLVPGDQWGDDVPWLAQAASVLAGDRPSVTVLVNGGEIARMDVAESMWAGRPVIAIADSGRSADELTAALRGQKAPLWTRAPAGSGLIQAVELAEGPARLSDAIAQILGVKE